MTVPTFPASLIGLIYPVGRSPIWEPSDEVSYSGQSAGFSNWVYPRYQFTLGFSYLSNDAAKTLDYPSLSGFFNQLNGPAKMFQYQFNEDCTATTQTFGTGTGAATAFQLIRTFGGFAEPVFAVASISQVRVAGSPVAGATYSFDQYGVLTFTTPPANGAALDWTGVFNWYCRFDDKTIDFSNFMSKYWELPTLKFTTVKL